MSEEIEEEMIERRSQNADGMFGLVLDGLIYAELGFWILIGIGLLVAVWLLG